MWNCRNLSAASFRFGISRPENTAPIPRAATACESLTPNLFLSGFLDLNGAAGVDFEKIMLGADEFRDRRVLLKDVQDIGVLGKVAEDVSVKASFDLLAF